MTVWKWSGESRYPGAFPLVLENFRRAFSPGLTDCPGSPRMGLFETMVISNLRNNPSPLSHNATFFLPLYNHFNIHGIFKFCFTFLTDLF